MAVVATPPHTSVGGQGLVIPLFILVTFNTVAMVTVTVAVAVAVVTTSTAVPALVPVFVSGSGMGKVNSNIYIPVTYRNKTIKQ